SRNGNRRQRSCYFDLVRYFFLKRPKIEISENLRFLARSFSASCVLTCHGQSKPNSRMIKMKTIGVVLMASSIIDKKSQRRGRRAEHQSTDSRRRTRRKHASRTLDRLDLSSRYFLKRSKIDISRNVKFLLERIPSFRIAYFIFRELRAALRNKIATFRGSRGRGHLRLVGLLSDIGLARRLTAQVLSLRAEASTDRAEIHGR